MAFKFLCQGVVPLCCTLKLWPLLYKSVYPASDKEAFLSIWERLFLEGAVAGEEVPAELIRDYVQTFGG